MSMRIKLASVRVYDRLKERPGASSRQSGARDRDLLKDLEQRLRELISDGRLNANWDQNGQVYVFMSDIDALMRAGLLDELIYRL